MIVSDREYGWEIARAAGTTFNPFSDVVMSNVENGRLLGGVIFTAYTGASVHLHAAGFDPYWLSRDMLWVTFNYSFEQLGCKVVFGQVPETNSKALEFNKKLGFKEVTRIPDVFHDGDLVLLAIRRETCRWLKIRPRQFEEPANGQQKFSTAAARL